MQDVIDRVVAEFKTKFPNVPVPPISWNPNMRTTAGKVKVCRKTRQGQWIQLNPHLLKNETDLDQTLMHELCHVADYVIYGKLGHGPTWKHCMRLVERQVRRCHQYDTTGLKRRHKRHPAKCNCRTYELTSIRVKKMQAGFRYSCRNCRGTLVLLSQNETEKLAISF